MDITYEAPAIRLRPMERLFDRVLLAVGGAHGLDLGLLDLLLELGLDGLGLARLESDRLDDLLSLGLDPDLAGCLALDAVGIQPHLDQARRGEPGSNPRLVLLGRGRAALATRITRLDLKETASRDKDSTPAQIRLHAVDEDDHLVRTRRKRLKAASELPPRWHRDRGTLRHFGNHRTGIGIVDDVLQHHLQVLLRPIRGIGHMQRKAGPSRFRIAPEIADRYGVRRLLAQRVGLVAEGDRECAVRVHVIKCNDRHGCSTISVVPFVSSQGAAAGISPARVVVAIQHEPIPLRPAVVLLDRCGRIPPSGVSRRERADESHRRSDDQTEHGHERQAQCLARGADDGHLANSFLSGTADCLARAVMSLGQISYVEYVKVHPVVYSQQTYECTTLQEY